VRELVSVGGYTVDIEDVEGFIKRIGACLDEEYPDGGRERIVEEHSWADTVERTTEVLAALSDGIK
jgi:hypothetical protein